MSGPLPKDPKLRQRTNKASTRATLVGGERLVRRPALPKRADAERAWHPLTAAWWRDVWRSPMAGEYLQADMHGLFVLAELVDAFWHEPSLGLAAEIRQQRQCFGLTPIDRRRLEWTVQRVEEGKRKRLPAQRPESSVDPRSVLKALA